MVFWNESVSGLVITYFKAFLMCIHGNLSILKENFEENSLLLHRKGKVGIHKSKSILDYDPVSQNWETSAYSAAFFNQRPLKSPLIC
jgi:hypothetical protein